MNFVEDLVSAMTMFLLSVLISRSPPDSWVLSSETAVRGLESSDSRCPWTLVWSAVRWRLEAAVVNCASF